MKSSKARIAATWDKIAVEYGGYGRKLWLPVSDFLSKTKAPVLDIGCGNASYLKNFSNKFIGIDISFETCKLASKHVESICGDAVFLPIKSNSFSRVLSVATIHHMPTNSDRLGFLREIKRVLKPRGRALVTALYSKRFLRKNVSRKWGEISRYYYLFSKRSLARLAGKVFTNFEIKVEQDARHKNLYLRARK